MILLVGNGPISPDAVSLADQASFVVRFNDCRSYADLPGPTHAVAICNTGRPGYAMATSTKWRSHSAIREAGELWCVRNPAKFLDLRAAILDMWPDLTDFCDDHTSRFATYCAVVGKDFLVFDRKLHDEVDRDLADLAAPPYVVPSSGMLALHYVLQRFAHLPIILVGFTHQGWEWHPFSAEKTLVDRYIRLGRVTRL
ncbi:Urease operon accessory protein [Labrys sp. 22185]|uniref:Urease operon accessory protein n=1 Tax=Labrys sp. 22185 TaxID=3453888 RepID=UPI003F8502C5